jgi:hypothetical protein
MSKPKWGTLIMLRGNHTSFVSGRTVSELADEIDAVENPHGFYFVQSSYVAPENCNHLAVRPVDVVALVAVGTPNEPQGHPTREQAHNSTEAVALLKDMVEGDIVRRRPQRLRY